MTTPTVNVSVTADIQALETGMKRAEATVAASTAQMANQIERGIGARFDNTFGNINRGFDRVGKGAQAGLATAHAAAADLDGTLSALPKTLEAVARLGKVKVNVPVTADIQALETGMKRAEASVAASTAQMAKTVKVPVTADIQALQTEMKKAEATVAALPKTLEAVARVGKVTVKVPVTADIQALQTGMKRVEATVAASTAQMAKTVKVPVTADMQALQTGMKRAEATVAASTAQMANQIERGFGARFDNTFGNINRGFGRVGKGAQVGLAAAYAAAGDLDGTLSALPGTLGVVAQIGKVTFDILYESITGAASAAKQLDEALARGQRVVDYRQQAEDLDRQIKIMQTGDEKAARRLQTEREIAAAQQRFLQANTEGATVEAKKVLDREILLAKMREEEDLLEIHLRLNEKNMDAIRKRNAEADKMEQEENERLQTREGFRRRMQDAQTRRQLAQDDLDPIARLMIEQAAAIRELHREREDMTNAEASAGGVAALNAEKAAIQAETNLELARLRIDAQEELNDLQDEFNSMSKTTDVETSFGGPMRVALEGGGRMSADMAKKQTALQERIAKIVEAISKNVGGGAIQ